MVFINLYDAPRSEWIDRGKAIATARLGLRTPAYAPFSFAGEDVSPFGAVGRRLGIGDGNRLVAIDGRPLPADSSERVGAMSGPNGVPVTLSLRRDDGTMYHVRVVRCPSYEKDAFAGSGMSVGTRRLASFPRRRARRRDRSIQFSLDGLALSAWPNDDALALVGARCGGRDARRCGRGSMG
jgi:hypothetical protein